jgi:hypothetical protein
MVSTVQNQRLYKREVKTTNHMLHFDAFLKARFSFRMEFGAELVAYATSAVGRLLHPGLRSELSSVLFIATELAMAFTCLGGPLLLGGT